MKKWLLLLVGILLILVLSHLCFKSKVDGIKHDLVGKVSSLYKDRGISNIDVNLVGDGLKLTRDIRLTGTVANKELKEKAEELALEVNGVRSVDNRLKIVASKTVEKSAKIEIRNLTPKPYTIRAVKQKSKKVVLSGYIVDSLEHLVILDKAQSLFGKNNVEDNLKEIKGAPKAWQESALLALENLAKVDYGEFNITDKNFKFRGYAKSDKLKNSLIGRINSNLDSNYEAYYDIKAPKKIKKLIAPKVVVPNPYTISAVKDKSKKIVLNGYVADIIEHKDVVNRAQSLFGRDNVEDNLKEIKGAPKAWKESALLGLENLAKVDYGEFNITDKNFKFRGYAKSDKLKNSLIDNLEKNLNGDYKGTYDLKALKVDKKVLCQKEFKKLLSSEKIKFKYDKALIKRDSYALLNRLVSIANRCPKAKIIIEGHTDSDGSSKYNYNLSKKRASAVKKYLMKKGIGQNRLRAVGYGESKPIATNKTDKGKEKNRRIEFKIEGVK